MSDALEKYYGSLHNVVLRDDNGNPSIFVRHPKIKSSDLFSILPDRTHPAFIVNDVEDPALLIGKYMGSTLVKDGTIYSLPYAKPDVVDDYRTYTHSVLLNRVRMFKGATGITIADYGLMSLLGQKYISQGNGTPCYGNINVFSSYEAGKHFGQDVNHGWVYPSVTVGDRYIYLGWLYECVKNHQTSANLPPSMHPELWKPLYRVGGVPVDESWYKSQTAVYRGNSLTGSGPIDWYFMHDICNEADFFGNGEELVYGVRIAQGELQILANNNAADPNAIVIGDEANWRAILPNQNNSEYTLVNPGETGTIKVLVGSNTVQFVTRDLTENDFAADDAMTSVYFNAITVNSAEIPYVPSILYELGLLAIPGSGVTGGMCMFRRKLGRTYYCSHGTYFTLTTQRVVFPIYNFNMEENNGVYKGNTRPRARETE